MAQLPSCPLGKSERTPCAGEHNVSSFIECHLRHTERQ